MSRALDQSDTIYFPATLRQELLSQRHALPENALDAAVP
jgi:hypothetical protein